MFETNNKQANAISNNGDQVNGPDIILIWVIVENVGDGYVTIRKVKKEVNENNYFEHIFFTQTFPERETKTANVKG